jgi:N6-L-threonylcarbamoyladenine synthase
MSDFFILGIESSCDETSASVVKNGREVLSNVISSQVDLHVQYGGVVPEIASRRHVELILPVIDQALKESGVSAEHLDGVAVTYGPGLAGALLVGLSAAKAFAFSINKPLIGVHHIEGHISANYIDHKWLEPPFTCLVVSGGHSHIVSVEDYGEFRIIGRTRDDAAGEAFDKISRALGLGYPGGPKIDNISKSGNMDAFNFPKVKFGDGSLDFSFSGPKTAVLNQINFYEQKGMSIPVADIAASFQKAVVEVLIENTVKAANITCSKVIAIAGGVACNSLLRKRLIEECEKNGIKAIYPSPILCTDNAAMIACVGYFKYIKKDFSSLDLNTQPGLSLETKK